MIIKLLDHDIEIVFIEVADWGGGYGDFDTQTLRIRIVKGYNRDVFLTTLFHELTHFKQYVFGLEMNEDEANRDGLFWHSVMKYSDIAEALWQAYTE